MAINPKQKSTFLGDPSSCCPPLFTGDCSDGSINVFWEEGKDPFVSWLGIGRPASVNESVRVMPYIVAPQGGGAGTPNDPAPAAICDLGAPVETPEPCLINYDCFGNIKRLSDAVVDGDTNVPYCQNDPATFVDGELVDNDDDWLENQVTTQVMSDLSCKIVTAPGPFAVSAAYDHYGLNEYCDGTFVWPCDYVAPKVLDWNSQLLVNPIDGVGITLDGNPVTGKYSQNINWALQSIANWQRVKAGGYTFGDVAIIGAQQSFECIVQAEACRLWCDDGVTRIDNAEARAFYYETLNAGIGFGEVGYGNMRIPFIPSTAYDWTNARNKFDNGDGTYDFFMMWRGRGNARWNQPVMPTMNTSRTSPTTATREDGRFQLKWVDDGDCEKLQMKNLWRWRLRRPWLVLCIQNVPCDALLDDAIIPQDAAADCITPPVE